ncbi:transposase [Bradyrhizobium sp. USDA 3311]
MPPCSRSCTPPDFFRRSGYPISALWPCDAQLVRQRVRLKNLIQSILHAHLIPPCPHLNLVGISGRRWIAAQIVPADERAAIERHLAQIDLIQGSLKEVEADIAREAMSDPIIRRLMTLPGVDMTVASGVAAAVGDIRRFADPTRLVSYLGLNPSVRQSGEGSAYHGRITEQGRGQARGMLVEAAWAVARSPGPLRAFFQRVASRRGKHIAAVATARKLAMIIWHMLTKSTDYIWTRPALLARKFRSIELRAGLPTSHAKRGSAYD